ncbi:unnamed protein product [Lepeophtheirus salmonis]|uniref:(salmon louse) hypothetical protein n=1 Tax=Lepeophtheirus salmonis TaxID=72036 RepID=A0A7R8H8J7_LEPSM|nr:unnamed protein product [Lepeophtheirus salmonis]CAF2939552.1 unnamed protein product [Lepeophtheirus salmonis]
MGSNYPGIVTYTKSGDKHEDVTQADAQVTKREVQGDGTHDGREENIALKKKAELIEMIQKARNLVECNSDPHTYVFRKSEHNYTDTTVSLYVGISYPAIEGEHIHVDYAKINEKNVLIMVDPGSKWIEAPYGKSWGELVLLQPLRTRLEGILQMNERIEKFETEIEVGFLNLKNWNPNSS